MKMKGDKAMWIKHPDEGDSVIFTEEGHDKPFVELQNTQAGWIFFIKGLDPKKNDGDFERQIMTELLRTKEEALKKWAEIKEGVGKKLFG